MADHGISDRCETKLFPKRLLSQVISTKMCAQVPNLVIKNIEINKISFHVVFLLPFFESISFRVIIRYFRPVYSVSPCAVLHVIRIEHCKRSISVTRTIAVTLQTILDCCNSSGCNMADRCSLAAKNTVN